jgi:choline dehydrogenase-like flavoprotein
MARIQFAAGAREVRSLHSRPVRIQRKADIDAALDSAPWEAGRVRVATAHQMGGCAMGADPRTSVVDSTLRYHGMENLFVVDGSVFPTSLGVNPQETIFGIARWASQFVAAATA